MEKHEALVLLWPRWSNQRQIKLEIHLSIMHCGTGVVWPIKVESQGRDACWPSVGLSPNDVININ